MAVAELTAEAPRSAASLNPFQVRGTALPPNVLLAAKVVTLVFLITGGWRLTDPFLPFIGFLGDLASPHAYQDTLQAIWLIAAASLLLNQLVRPASLATQRRASRSRSRPARPRSGSRSGRQRR